MKKIGLMLFSNKEILKGNKVPLGIIFFIFIINVLLLSAPLFNARATVNADQLIDRFPGLEEAFEEIYDLNIPCEFTKEGPDCDKLTKNLSDYQLVILEEATSDKTIEFQEDYVLIKYKDTDQEVSLVGSYYFLDSINLQNITKDKYYETTETIVYAIASSTIGNDFFLIFMGQFIQILIYFLAISALLNVANYKQRQKKISYLASVKITILAMMGPALLSALIGFFFMSFSTLVFMTVYSLRMMYIYFKILAKKVGIY
ncbi:hypothetical protein RJG79_03885 [Mycoplasmatota bacterium WC44]